MSETELVFEWKCSLRGQTIVTAKLGDEVIFTDKLDISRADQRKKFIQAMCMGRRGLAKYRKHAATELDNLAAKVASAGPTKKTGSGTDGQQEQFIPYARTHKGLCLIRQTEGGEILIPLTNFDARIVADMARDDGAEVERSFEIEMRLGEHVERFDVPASSFATMNWPMEHFGSEGIVYAGSTVRDHARVAIQLLSGERKQLTVYTHMGWRKIEGQWVYLHTGGAIGPCGALANASVDLGDSLSLYQLPDPPLGQELKDAIVATLRRLDLAPDIVSVPTFIAPFRAAMGQCDFTMHLAGATGVFKSEVAALMNQHFGPGIDGRHLPASWHGTDNALEGLAFITKDAIIVIDDFAPAGPPHEVQKWHQKADRIIRHQGNNNSRQRMRADSSLRPPKPPRGLLVSTGEDVPRGQSLRARMFIIDLSKGDVAVDRLSACQVDAACGLYAAAMAGFIQWLAARYVEVHKTLRAQINELRQEAVVSEMHRRTPDIVASLAVGLKYFLAFAQDAGAVSREQADALWRRGWLALGQVAAKQDAYHRAGEPTRRFIELLLSPLASGHAHIAGPGGGPPGETPEAWGWRLTTIGRGPNQDDEWRPQGDRVGWIEDETIYLEPEASYRQAQAMTAGSADGLGITAQTLRKRMHEQGLLVLEGCRQALTVRKTLEGQLRVVLQLRVGALVPKITDIPDISDVPDRAADAQRPKCQESQVSGGVDPEATFSKSGRPVSDGAGAVAPPLSETEVADSEEDII